MYNEDTLLACASISVESDVDRRERFISAVHPRRKSGMSKPQGAAPGESVVVYIPADMSPRERILRYERPIRELMQREQ